MTRTNMKFEKISFEQWKKDAINLWSFDDDKLLEIYNDIKLPKQGTASSMGMDFFIPYDLPLYNGNAEIIPTGIRWVVNKADGNVGLIIVPRSGLGFKHGIRLENTVGIIDADYQFADNEGHIMIKLRNPSKLRSPHNQFVELEKGKAFAQGIVLPYQICDGAESDENRTGGFGSTG